jgi:very-short-patch-repair endonuclease
VVPPVTEHLRIAVVEPLWTLVDLAVALPANELERAVNEADRLGLIRIDSACETLESSDARRGVRKLHRLLLKHTATDSELERRFLKLVQRAGLPEPLTQVVVEGFRVDFYWPDLGLVIETDGLTYHRTPSQQAKDRIRDQKLTAAGLTCLRFTNRQVRDDANEVVATVRVVSARLRRAA